MADIVSPEKRSQMMAGIRGKNTKPEIVIRNGLHRRGLRFRVHNSRLPGKPDLLFPRFGAIIFVHGCFWHGHECSIFKWPQSRPEFWRRKIEGNRERDQRMTERLLAQGYRVRTVWECETRASSEELAQTLDEIASWVRTARG
jgi:DNA mismatch endonuclease (patch repair protein)